jgi:RNA polymerase sigma factor (TIGR02999 family)
VHFFSLAARAMRQIIIDRGRRMAAEKRGGALDAVPLDEATIMSPGAAQSVVQLEEALLELEKFDARKARLVELRYFGGMKMEEVADAEQISSETVRRELRLAEAWLLAYLRR